MAAIYREVYHDKHCYIGVGLSNLAGVSQQRGDNRRAEALFREVLQRYADTLPPGHQLTGIAKIRRGRARWLDAAREDLAKLPNASAAARLVLDKNASR
jgi:hypothetical protein